MIVTQAGIDPSPLNKALDAVGQTNSEQAQKIKQGFKEKRISLKTLLDKLRRQISSKGS